MMSCNPEEDLPTFVYDGDTEELSLLGGAEDAGGIDKIVVDELRLRGFVLVRHTYSRTQQRLLQEVAAFFALNDEEKAGIAGGAGMRKIKGRPVGVLAGRFSQIVSLDDCEAPQTEGGRGLIPSGFNSTRLRVPVLGHVSSAAGIARAVCRCIERYLTGSDGSTALESCVDFLSREPSEEGVSNSTVRFCRYSAGAGGFEPHTDTSFFTVIASAGRGKASSLEILSPGGNEWRAIDRLIADDSSVVVFPGDYMAIISKEAVPAAVGASEHGRVIARGSYLGADSAQNQEGSALAWGNEGDARLRRRSGLIVPPSSCRLSDGSSAEPLAMDDLEAYCSVKRKRQAVEHRDEGDNWILSSRDIGAPSMMTRASLVAGGMARNSLRPNRCWAEEMTAGQRLMDPPKREQRNLSQVMSDTNLGEVAEPLSFGMISGFCSGFFLKKVGKAAAVTFGVVFVTFQAAAQAGYVNVNWDAVQRDVMKGLDMDGDGEVTEMDAREAVVRAVNYLTENTGIAAGSFMAGFVLGVRKG
ncbi:hypothetical protein FOZ62_009102 [Perkinsus olseni]|nr:hypothetical protein FOZ62_009102 [Perkinsus olseni]